MNKSLLSISIIGIILGALFFIYGGADDSPGAQLIGAIVVLAGIVGIVKSKKKHPSP